MDERLYELQPQYSGQEPYAGWNQQENYMALASMIMGVLSIVTACCFLTAFVLGGLAVIFAALSRVDERMCSKGKAGLIMGIIGMMAGFASIYLWIYFGT